MAKNKLRILILNWRDIYHPLAGGAEQSLHEHAKYWSKKGALVTWISSAYGGCKKSEMVDGIKVIRYGNHYTVHLLSFIKWVMHKIPDCDIVIDSFHFVPFFSPLYLRNSKIIALINEPAKNAWFKNIFFPVSLIGYLLEPLFFIPYRKRPFITSADSIEKELVKDYLIPKKNIYIIPHGVSLPSKLPSLEKEKKPTVVYCSRLTIDKGIEDAVEAISYLKSSFPDLKFWIIGKPEKADYLTHIKKMAKEKGISDITTFFGFVTEEKKFELLSRSWILVHPSTREGWGLNVIEAASVGTPTVGYDVPGLRDSIMNKKTGILTKKNPDSLAKGIEYLLQNKQILHKFSKQSKGYAKLFSWEESTKNSWNLLCKEKEKINKKFYFYLGTTAEFIKIAPVIREFQRRKIKFKIIASGQNRILFNELEFFLGKIKPDIVIGEKTKKSSIFHFGIWSFKALFKSISKLRKEFELSQARNTHFIVHGDTISSLIGAIVAKIYRLKLVHVESGLRSYDFFEPFPEEICRFIVSRLADIHFSPNKWSMDNIKKQNGIKVNTYENTSIESFWSAIRVKNANKTHNINRPYYVLVLHRQEHTIFGKKTAERLINTILDSVDKKISCVLIGHDLTLKLIMGRRLSNKLESQKVNILPRLSYVDFVHLLRNAEFIATDGGSNQEEAYYLGKPCLILRNKTERIEGLGENAELCESDMKKIKKFIPIYRNFQRKEIYTSNRPSAIIADFLIKTP